MTEKNNSSVLKLQDDHNKASLFLSLWKGIKGKFNQVPLLKRVLSGEFKANDISALLVIIGFVVMALTSVKIVQNHKNKEYFRARNHYVYLVLFSGMYIMHVLPNISGEPLGLFVLRDVENEHEMATLVDVFSSSGIFTTMNRLKLPINDNYYVLVNLLFGFAGCVLFSVKQYTEFFLSKTGQNRLDKANISNLESQKIALDDKKFFLLTVSKQDFEEAEKTESSFEDTDANNLDRESKLYLMLCSLCSFVKGLIKYMSLVSLFGFLPQKYVFNSTPMFATLGRVWCLKLDHFLYGIRFCSYYNHIRTFLDAFSMKSIIDLIISTSTILNFLMLELCVWLTFFFKDLFFNVFFLSLYFLMGDQEKYFRHANSVFTLKGLELLMKSDKFPRCFEDVGSCTQEEAIDQVAEFFCWSYGVVLNSFVALITLSLVILPFINFLVQELRVSLS